MQILNVGTLELIFILLLALIVLGPKRAIKTAGEIGQWVKELIKSPFWQEIVSTSKEIQDLPKKIMDEADIQKTIEELDSSTKEVNQTLQETQKSLRGNITKIGQSIQTPPSTQSETIEEEA